MWRDTNARPRAIIDQNLPALQLTRCLQAVRDIDGHDAATLFRGAGRIHAKSSLIGEVDQALRLAQRLGADAVDSNFINDLITAAGRIQRGDGGRAVEKTVRIVREIDGTGGEGKGRPMRGPAGRGGL